MIFRRLFSPKYMGCLAGWLCRSGIHEQRLSFLLPRGGSHEKRPKSIFAARDSSQNQTLQKYIKRVTTRSRPAGWVFQLSGP